MYCKNKPILKARGSIWHIESESFELSDYFTSPWILLYWNLTPCYTYTPICPILAMSMEEGTSSYDLGKWRTLPLSPQAQMYFVWLCFYVFCNKWDFEAYYWQKLWSASKVPTAVIDFNCNLNGITNGKEKMEMRESGCKKQKQKY